jgi:hypothetical protein
MRKDTPSKTARKVALNIVTLGAKPGMEKVLPPGIVETTAELLIACGAVGATAVRWSRSRRMVSVYQAFDWMMPGQFEAFGHRKAFCEHQVREAVVGGAKQVLVLGAGYDTMGWRLAPEFFRCEFLRDRSPSNSQSQGKGYRNNGVS